MDKKLQTGLIAIFDLLLLAMVAYPFLEGWSVLDSLYFASFTLTTVGYGDITPHTDAGKIFTIGFLWAGIAITLYTLVRLSKYEEQGIERAMNVLGMPGKKQREKRNTKK